MVNIGGYEIPNLASELTVEQFDRLNAITKDPTLDNIEKQMSKFEYLGVGSEVFDNMTLEEFKKYNRKFNESEHDLNKTKTLEIDGYTYEAPEIIGVKDLGMIEKVWKQSTNTFAVDTLAILFKRTDLTKKEHYANAHLKQKARLFKDLKASVAIPYIVDILTELTQTAKKANDEATEELARDNG